MVAQTLLWAPLATLGGQSLMGAFPSICVPALENDAAHSMMRGLGARQGIRFEDDALAALVKASGGVPLLLRRLGTSGYPARVMVTHGAQHAIAAVLRAIARPGDTVLTEALSYPGLIALAQSMRLQLIGVAIDNEGLEPAALDRAARTFRSRLLFCSPTLHNPTGATQSLARRHEIAEIARRRSLLVIDLKIGEFSYADAGQMHMYLNYAREHWTKPGENPPVGLILCARTNAAASCTCCQGTPSPGSMSNTTRSGRSKRVTLEFQVWNSITPNWASAR